LRIVGAEPIASGMPFLPPIQQRQSREELYEM